MPLTIHAYACGYMCVTARVTACPCLRAASRTNDSAAAAHAQFRSANEMALPAASARGAKREAKIDGGLDCNVVRVVGYIVRSYRDDTIRIDSWMEIL